MIFNAGLTIVEVNVKVMVFIDMSDDNTVSHIARIVKVTLPEKGHLL